MTYYFEFDKDDVCMFDLPGELCFVANHYHDGRVMEKYYIASRIYHIDMNNKIFLKNRIGSLDTTPISDEEIVILKLKAVSLL